MFLLLAKSYYDYWHETAISNVTVVPTGIAVSSYTSVSNGILPDVTATPTGIAVNFASIGSYSVAAGGEITTIVGSEFVNYICWHIYSSNRCCKSTFRYCINNCQGSVTQASAVVAQPTGIGMTTARGSISFTSDLIVDLQVMVSHYLLQLAQRHLLVVSLLHQQV